MVHIVEFSISNLAGNEGKYSQKLSRDINIFFGLNGSGKTSLLKILHSAMNNDADILYNVPFNTAEVTIYSDDYKKEFTYFIEQKNIIQTSETISEVAQATLFDAAESIGRGERTSSRNITWVVKPKLPSRFGGLWAHRYLPTSRLYLGISTYRGIASIASLRRLPSEELSPEEQLDILFSSNLERLWSRYSSNISKAVRQAQEDGLASIFKAVLSAGEQKEIEQMVDPEIAYNRVAAFLKRQGSQNSIGSLVEFRNRYANSESFAWSIRSHCLC